MSQSTHLGVNYEGVINPEFKDDMLDIIMCFKFYNFSRCNIKCCPTPPYEILTLMKIHTKNRINDPLVLHYVCLCFFFFFFFFFFWGGGEGAEEGLV